MEKRETILFYLLSVIGLVVVSILATNRIERVEIQPLPTNTPAKIITPQSITSSPETRPPLPTKAVSKTGWIECATTPRGVTFGYPPQTASHTNDTLTISGTVYAEDFETPLPDVQVEIWRPTPEGLGDHLPPFILLERVRTDGTGRYAFTISRPNPLGGNPQDVIQPIHFLFQLSYLGDCPPSVPRPATIAPENHATASTLSRSLFSEGVKQTGMMLRGPVDFALLVSPPTPQVLNQNISTK